MRQLDVVSPLVAVQPSQLPGLVVVASPLVALPPPLNAAAWDGSSGRLERATSRVGTATKIEDNEDNKSKQCGDIFQRARKRTPQKASESDAYSFQCRYNGSQVGRKSWVLRPTCDPLEWF